MAVKPIPDGYQTVTPYLTIEHPEAVMDFLKKAFDGKELYAMRDDQGQVQHAEMKVGSSMLMFGRAHGEWHARPGNFYLYVEDVDKSFQRAIDAGGQSKMPVADMFWGDRLGAFVDPFGHNWTIATHTQDMSLEELKEGEKKFYAQMQQAQKKTA